MVGRESGEEGDGGRAKGTGGGAWALAAERPRDGDSVWLDEVALRAQSALRGYRLQAKLLGKRLTPNVALLRFEGSDLLTVKGVERVRNELLTTHGLRVCRVSAEPGAVVVAVERLAREGVTVPGVLATRQVDSRRLRADGRFVVGVRGLDALTLCVLMDVRVSEPTRLRPSTDSVILSLIKIYHPRKP